MPLVQGFMSAVPAASSVMNAYMRGSPSGPLKFGTSSYLIGYTVCGPRPGGLVSISHSIFGFLMSEMSQPPASPEPRKPM